eukprot:TRINITY_DN5857_c0_g1_i2.p1 TRINITY_DN5857_c0_g1~~TRINITY_DN5857_c0_g1_i2.p1  ORF type:complete len:384 (-),score=91.31 TRINITY_DN5857_c0_g1_i2:39-1190(-)
MAEEELRVVVEHGKRHPAKAGTAEPEGFHLLVAASLGNYPMASHGSLAAFVEQCPGCIPSIVKNLDNSEILVNRSWPTVTEHKNLWAAAFALRSLPELRQDGVLFELHDTDKSGVTYKNPTLYAVVKKEELNKLEKPQYTTNSSRSNGAASMRALLMVIDAHPKLRSKWIHKLKGSGERVVVTAALINFFVRCVGGVKLLFAVERRRNKLTLQSFGGHIEPIDDKNLVETAIRELKEEWRGLPARCLNEKALRKRLNKLFHKGESAHEITKGDVLDPDRTHDSMHFRSFGPGRCDAHVSFKLDMTKEAGWSDCSEVERMINEQLLDSAGGEVIAATWVQASSKKALKGASWTSNNQERATFAQYCQDSFDVVWNEIHSLRLTE